MLLFVESSRHRFPFFDTKPSKVVAEKREDDLLDSQRLQARPGMQPYEGPRARAAAATAATAAATTEAFSAAASVASSSAATWFLSGTSGLSVPSAASDGAFENCAFEKSECALYYEFYTSHSRALKFYKCSA